MTFFKEFLAYCTKFPILGEAMTIKITYIYKSQRFKPLHQAYISPGRYIMCLLLQEVHQSHFHTMCACFRPIFSSYRKFRRTKRWIQNIWHWQDQRILLLVFTGTIQLIHNNIIHKKTMYIIALVNIYLYYDKDRLWLFGKIC